MPHGWYSPLVVAWTGQFPAIGARVPMTAKYPGQEGCPHPVLYIVREVTREAWAASQAERGFPAQERPGQRYFEVQVD